MKVKFVWFDKSNPAFMTLCFQKWCARQGGHPSSVKTSVLTLWKAGAVALILPHFVFDIAQGRAADRRPDDPPPPLPLSDGALPL